MWAPTWRAPAWRCPRYVHALETAARPQHIFQCSAACLTLLTRWAAGILAAHGFPNSKVLTLSSICADAWDGAGAGVQHGAAVAQPAVCQSGHLPPVQGASPVVTPVGELRVLPRMLLMTVVLAYYLALDLIYFSR